MAILESGAAAAFRTRDEAQPVTEHVLGLLGGTVDDLVAAPVARILEIQNAVTGGSDATGYLAFRPVVDGVHLPERPDAALAAGQALDIPVVVGTNRDEMSLFFAFDPRVAALKGGEVSHRAGQLLGAERWSRMEEHYRSRAADGDTATLMAGVATDAVFRIPALQLADAMAARSPVWMYRLDWTTPAMGGRLGAPHALDIPFVWNLLDFPGVELFTGSAPGRHHLARAMHGAWLAFATTGDPATPLLPEWAPYRPPARATMLFDAECRVVDDPNGAERELWDEAV